jgi:hypothetical protein
MGISTWLKPSLTPWTNQDKPSFGASPYQPPTYDNAVFKNANFNAGRLTDELQLHDLGPISNDLNTQGLEALRGQALAAPGTSAWEQMMVGRQGLDEASARDRATSSADAGVSQAYSNLATHGGLSQGARERLAAGGARNSAAARQGVARQGAMDRLGIGAQAEQNRLGLLSALPGQETQKASFDTGLAQGNREYSTGVEGANIGNFLNQFQNHEAAKQGAYQAQMQDWAAMNQANATANSGKK